MIPMLSRYLQQLHYNRHYWLAREEKRQALRLACLILLCIGIIILLWTRH